VAVDVLGLTIMIPLLPFYAERMGASPAQVGWLIGIYAACQLVSGPFLGRWSDSTGRKPLLIVSQLGTCLGFIVTAFAPNLWVLTGISRADRWPELRPSALEQVWLLCRSLAAVTVVDLGFCLEQDEELSFEDELSGDPVTRMGFRDARGLKLLTGGVDDVAVVAAIRRVARARRRGSSLFSGVPMPCISGAALASKPGSSCCSPSASRCSSPACRSSSNGSPWHGHVQARTVGYVWALANLFGLSAGPARAGS
jgi:MFS family permease